MSMSSWAPANTLQRTPPFPQMCLFSILLLAFLATSSSFSPVPTVATSNKAIKTSGYWKSGHLSAFTSIPIGTLVHVLPAPRSSANPKKTWKKRRRSSSPVLVPATLLSFDLPSSVASNVEFIVNKYAANTPQGRSLSISKLENYYTVIFEAPIHGTNGHLPGFADVKSALASLPLPDHLSLTHTTLLSTHSASLAKNLSSYKSSCLTSIATPSPTDTTMSPLSTCKLVTPTASVPAITYPNLSCALRLPPSTLPSESITAYVTSFSADGDAGLPLLTVSLEAPSSRYRNPRRDESVPPTFISTQTGPTINYDKLTVGSQLTGTIVALDEYAETVTVDCGVTRKIGSSRGGGTENLLSVMKFDDMMEGIADEDDDDEEDEFDPQPWEGDADNAPLPAFTEESLKELKVPELKDELRARSLKVGGNKAELIARLLESSPPTANLGFDLPDTDEEEGTESVTDLNVSVAPDGTLSYVDEETGETVMVGNIADLDDEFDELGLDDSELVGLSPSERLEKIAEMLLANEVDSSEPSPLPTSLGVGDTVTAYVKTVSAQSGTYTLTLSPAASAPSSKSSREAEKKLTKLTEMPGFQQWLDMAGTKTPARVVAASKDFKLLFVQVDDVSIPVAVCENTARVEHKENTPVTVVMAGLDETRGQLKVELA